MYALLKLLSALLLHLEWFCAAGESNLMLHHNCCCCCRYYIFGEKEVNFSSNYHGNLLMFNLKTKLECKVVGKSQNTICLTLYIFPHYENKLLCFILFKNPNFAVCSILYCEWNHCKMCNTIFNNMISYLISSPTCND